MKIVLFESKFNENIRSRCLVVSLWENCANFRVCPVFNGLEEKPYLVSEKLHDTEQ